MNYRKLVVDCFTSIQTDRLTDRKTDRRTDRHTDNKTDRQTDRHLDTDKLRQFHKAKDRVRMKK